MHLQTAWTTMYIHGELHHTDTGSWHQAGLQLSVQRGGGCFSSGWYNWTRVCKICSIDEQLSGVVCGEGGTGSPAGGEGSVSERVFMQVLPLTQPAPRSLCPMSSSFISFHVGSYREMESLPLKKYCQGVSSCYSNMLSPIGDNCWWFWTTSARNSTFGFMFVWQIMTICCLQCLRIWMLWMWCRGTFGQGMSRPSHSGSDPRGGAALSRHGPREDCC